MSKRTLLHFRTLVFFGLACLAVSVMGAPIGADDEILESLEGLPELEMTLDDEDVGGEPYVSTARTCRPFNTCSASHCGPEV